MAKILISPVSSSGVEPFEVEGEMTSAYYGGELIYFIDGRSFPAEVVAILEA